MALLAFLAAGISMVLSVASASAGPAEVLNLRLDRHTITIGDTFNLYLETLVDSNTEIRMPDLKNALGEFVIRDHRTIREDLGDGRIKQVDRLQLSVFALGQHSIPSIPLLVIKDGDVDTLWTDQVAINVASIVPDQADEIRDIKPPLKAPRRWKEVLLSYIILAGLVAGSAASVIASMRRREEIVARLRAILRRIIGPIARLVKRLMRLLGLAGKKISLDLDIVVNEPGLPPDQIAIRELQKIEDLGLVERGMIKEYYTLLSEVIRRYLERRFGVPVMESTTTETLTMLRGVEIGSQPYWLVEDLLRESDLVKFAKFIPPKEVASGALLKARQIVELTREVTAKQAVGEI